MGQGAWAGRRWSGARGQSTLEYLLVISVILAAVIVGSIRVLKPAVSGSLNESANVITNSTAKLKNGLNL